MAHGARVTVVARGAKALGSVRGRLGGATISPDVTDEKLQSTAQFGRFDCSVCGSLAPAARRSASW